MRLASAANLAPVGSRLDEATRLSQRITPSLLVASGGGSGNQMGPSRAELEREKDNEGKRKKEREDEWISRVFNIGQPSRGHEAPWKVAAEQEGEGAPPTAEGWNTPNSEGGGGESPTFGRQTRARDSDLGNTTTTRLSPRAAYRQRGNCSLNQ